MASTREKLVLAVASMEHALADTLRSVNTYGSTDDIEAILKLIIKKEMLLEFLLEEYPAG